MLRVYKRLCNVWGRENGYMWGRENGYGTSQACDALCGNTSLMESAIEDDLSEFEMIHGKWRTFLKIMCFSPLLNYNSSQAYFSSATSSFHPTLITQPMYKNKPQHTIPWRKHAACTPLPSAITQWRVLLYNCLYVYAWKGCYVNTKKSMLKLKSTFGWYFKQWGGKFYGPNLWCLW